MFQTRIETSFGSSLKKKDRSHQRQNTEGIKGIALRLVCDANVERSVANCAYRTRRNDVEVLAAAAD